MTQNRIRIVDVADALGLSTATVSKVIHGKTEKISDETAERTGNTFDATVFMEVSDDGKTKFSMEFENGGKRK